MQKKQLWVSLSILGALVLALLGAIAWGAQQSQPTSSKRLKIVTTFYPMYEFTKAIVGTHAQVSMVIPAGTEPHDFEPTAKDVAKIAQADLLVYSSPYMETWVKSLAKTLQESNTTSVNAGAHIKFQSAAKTLATSSADAASIKEKSSEKDPHVWLDPTLAITMVQNIERQVIKADPAHAATYRRNAAKYIKQLRKLATAYASLKNSKNKVFITAHAAFGYLAKRYGLTQIAVAGISDEVEPSAKRIAKLETYIRHYHVKAIFAESSSSGKLAKSLAKSTNIKVYPLNPLESLTTKQQANNENYLTVMYQNLRYLKKVLN